MTEFIDCVLHDKPTKTTVEDGLQALRMGLAAKKSLAEHRPVKNSARSKHNFNLKDFEYMKRSHLTMSQAGQFLDNQYIECDGVESKFVSGIFAFFGHGCVVGVGQALEGAIT